MSLILSDRDDEGANPIDLIERVAIANEWPYHREAEEELAIEIAGQWCHYRIGFAWHLELGILHVSTPLDMKIPPAKREQICVLLAMANEKLWIGHFDFFWDESVPMFRHAVLFRDGTTTSTELVEDLIDISISECDRFYPAFQFVIWSDKSAKDAMTSALLETEGEA